MFESADFLTKRITYLSTIRYSWTMQVLLDIKKLFSIQKLFIIKNDLISKCIRNSKTIWCWKLFDIQFETEIHY